MTKGLSVYLDIVRFVAACLVYLYHSNQRFLITDPLPWSTYGHSAVIVFFVLSGFVIAYVTAEKENTWTKYSASRISRVYSVALPAVILTLVLDTAGRAIMPAIYEGYPYDQFAIRSLASLMFANEVWFISITSFSNVPYWSICYEMWYYVAFGFLVFLPRRIGVTATVIAACLLGPKIVLLAPLWALGVVVYRWQAPRGWSPRLSWLLFLSSTLLIVLYHAFDVSGSLTTWLAHALGAELHRNLTFSKFFPGDYLLGILVATNFMAARNVAPAFEAPLARIARPVQAVASYTFTLYLLHQPLFLFWGAVIGGNPKTPAYWLATTAMMAVSVYVIGYFTENKRAGIRRALHSRLNTIDETLRKSYAKA